MKILIINFEYPPLGGGGGVATRWLAKELSRRHEVHVLTTCYKHLLTIEHDGAVVVRRVSVLGRRDLYTASLLSLATFVPTALLAGWRMMFYTRFDVINAQFALPSGVVGAVLAWLKQVPFVLSFIGGDLYDPSKRVSPHRHAALRWLVRWVASRACVCTAISEDTKRRARELHGVRENIVVTPLGIPDETGTRRTRVALGVAEHAPVFITIGRLIPRKGHEALLRAWQDVPAAHLLVLGDGPLRERLKQQVQALKLSERVELRGFVSEEEKRQLLRLADGYVSAAHHEGFGLVFLEAMQAGLPIVAVNQGGHTDFLVHGENALLVPAGNTNELAAAVRQLVQDRELAARLRQRSQQHAAAFTAAAAARVFERVLAGCVKA